MNKSLFVNEDESCTCIGGTLKVKSEPKGAAIYINQRHVGKTPYTVKHIRPGHYTIVFEKRDCFSAQQDVEIVEGKAGAVHEKLIGVLGQIDVKSSPPGANVFIDDEEVGITPFSLIGVTVGRHQVRLTKSDYAKWDSTVMVGSGKKKTVSATLRKAVTNLRLTSEPTGAAVFVDDIHEGTTPITISGLVEDFYQIEFKLDRFSTFSSEVMIDSLLKDFALHGSLTPLTEILLINSQPAGADVLIDGSLKGTTPFLSSSIKTGKRWIRLRLPEYLPWYQNVEIDLHPAPVKLDVKLEKKLV